MGIAARFDLCKLGPGQGDPNNVPGPQGAPRHQTDQFVSWQVAIIIHGGKLQEDPQKECADSMVIDYNQGKIAEQYQKAKTQPWRARIEAYSFLKAIGDVKNKKVLDVACGEGHYTRLLRRAGAEVVGIDISERMVALAREQEAREPLGITYLVEDARTIVSQQDFDVVVAAYLLVHAQDRCEAHNISNGWIASGRSSRSAVSKTRRSCSVIGRRTVKRPTPRWRSGYARLRPSGTPRFFAYCTATRCGRSSCWAQRCAR